MRLVLTTIVCLAATGGAVAGSTGAWNRKNAFDFMESRQREWAAWRPAQKAGGPCISCHTGLSYMLARRASGAVDPGPAERDLVTGVTQRSLATPPTVTMPDPGAEAVLNLVTLALQRPKSRPSLSPAERAALSTLWERQLKEGPGRGSWSWVDAGLEPFDAPHSAYFGTALAAFALSLYPEAPADRVAAVDAYLAREVEAQPLHTRLAYVAFASKPEPAQTRSIVDTVWRVQDRDGGWTTASMGPWLAQEGSPPDRGSNAYITGWTSYALIRSGVACSDSRLVRALDWLVDRQEASTGAWRAVSMNKEYPKGSIQQGFMTDAATGFATAALLACGR